MANLDLTSMFNGRITSGDNSEKLGLRVVRDMGRYTICENRRAPLFRGVFNQSAYQLACGVHADESAYVELRGSVIIGRKSTPDGWVPQLANKILARSRRDGVKLAKEFMSFFYACVQDENTTSAETFLLPSYIHQNEEVLIDLNLIASHSVEAPTWMDEDPAVVLAYLSIRAKGELRRILKNFSSSINADWSLE